MGILQPVISHVRRKPLWMLQRIIISSVSGRKREAHLVLILHFLVEKLQPGLSKPQPSRLPEL